MARILLVEDDPMQRREYARYLRSTDGGGHEVDEAKSATQALQLAHEHAYDLVLLDIMLAYEPEDEANSEIVDSVVDYGRKMGVYVYRKIRESPNPPAIGLVSVVDDLAVLSEFPDVVGRLGKYLKTLDELGQAVERWLPKHKRR
jgi:CheY-like chemotaxis protein